MANEACKLLLEIDGYFKNENVDEEEFKKNDSLGYRCPYEDRKLRPCENNYERINALGVYLYQKLAVIANKLNGEGNNANRHIEIFMMWLSDKLYKLEKNKTKILEESYEKILKDYTGNFKYWNVIDSKRVYKRANVWYMSELYSLLKSICSIVIEYNKNKSKKKIEQISSECYQKFMNINKDIKDCYSYFHLLKYLKSIYDGIRNDAIKDADSKKDAITKNLIRNNDIKKAVSKAMGSQKNDSKQILERVLKDLTISLKDLTTTDWNQRFSDDSDKIVDFHTQNCVELYSELEKKLKKDTPKNEPTEQSQSGSNKLETQQQAEAPVALPPPPEPQKQDSPSPPQPPEKPEDNKDKTPSVPEKESSQPQLPKSSQSQEPTLETNQEGSDKSSKDPPSNENIPEPSPSLPGGEKKEPENTQMPTPGGQSSDKPQAPPPTQDNGSPDSNQMNPSDPSPKKQSQTSVDSSSKTPNLGIISKSPGISIEKKVPQLLKIKDIFKGYNRPETAIAVILIPIISLIIYKYLSRERTKKSEKKNMKKVINLAYGKRKTQIIIKSCDRTKDLKPVINSVDRKKDSLLNIHKLMQANSIPFINLFFLLIFLSIKENTIFWNYKFN
ncbi:CIR protein [Plasmodium chabaudi chabaudi]|uniref:CIR protein n=1 Tax=Plasmodium chabaudi chabaudi TaxID=31271 RepID=Q7YZ80_PLACU|nr:CIR protein [Plasmodium chabaudi chabaudi]AAO06136.1 PC10110c [Plasmodium chabaudi chabaudi]VTZ68206.1 CIR protein [Plasmodium chabaudi chabaudi]